VQRAIIRFHQDDEGEGVAELACGHHSTVACATRAAKTSLT